MRPADKGVNSKQDFKIGAHSRIVGSVTIGRKVIIGENVVIYGPARIGDGSYIGDNSIVGYPNRDELRNNIKKGSHILERSANKGSYLGENVIIRSGCTIYGNVRVGNNVEFGNDALVRENTTIGDDTIVGSKVIIDGNCQVGNKVLLHSAAYICAFSRIEDGVFVGPYVVFTNDKYANQIAIKMKGPIIKKNASIGAGAIVLPGVIIEEGSLIGAGCVVTKNTKRGAIYVGNPAQKLKEVQEVRKKER